MLSGHLKTDREHSQQMDNFDFSKFISNERYRHRALDRICRARDRSNRLKCGLLRRLSSALDQHKALERQQREELWTSPDIATLIRQYLNYFCGGSTKLPLHFCEKASEGFSQCDLESSKSSEDGVCRITARPWKAEWLTRGQSMLDGRPKYKRPDTRVDGDGFLTVASNGEFTSYKSVSQRLALHAVMTMPEGGSLLAVLPTGEGKSLIGIAEAVRRTQSGLERCGTTLVIVPTISLAMDQQKNARQFFQGMPPPKLPGCYSGSNAAEKARVREGISEGTLPIVYTSPESVIRGGLKNAVDQAAYQGTLHAIVLDEVHMLESWGESFRPEFIWLSSLRNELRESSGGRLKTVLLSATVSKNCEVMLKDLFADSQNPLCVIDGRALRPEPEFWYNEEHSWNERREHVRDIVFHLPRPFIIYTTRVRDAERWISCFREWGFTRVASFTGDTDDSDRRRLVDMWNNDEIDVMVATSAFGLGIDKADIRAIIHTCLPESIDRYYQEVGRSGRDGFASFSILLPVHLGEGRDDYGIASSLASGQSLNEKLMPRWKALWDNRMRNNDGSYNINLDAIHAELGKTSDENRRWNRSLLGSLVKTGIVRLVPPYLPDSEEEVTDEFFVGMEVLDEELIRNKRTLEESLLAQRERETESRWANFELMREAATVRLEDCIGHIFMSAYNMSYGIACGGCEYCRKHHEDATKPHDPRPLVDGAWSLNNNNTPLGPDLERFIGPYFEFILTYRSPTSKASRQDILKALVFLAKQGTQQFIVAEDKYQPVKKALSSVRGAWTIKQHGEVLPDYCINFAMPIVIYYEDSAPRRMEHLFLWQKDKTPEKTAKIHLMPNRLSLPRDEGRLLRNLLNCNRYSIQEFLGVM